MLPRFRQNLQEPSRMSTDADADVIWIDESGKDGVSDVFSSSKTNADFRQIIRPKVSVFHSTKRENTLRKTAKILPENRT